ncbi:30S ribosomal protein S1 [Alicyclobacillus cellulosilyticus]|uniref:30S ribosomal protein S1 n=1 Tax=Alicyclobacillus cellulosilyticus TaxID=1003997 RepID=A0A917NLS1_9BACL|nr:30S ribosomal protein S1 [Alicyclobacillus cellulosilyticus]GGJ10271.1 30S ribosomal protein S1 [Alicyclobacillus cellulosilyticus]
MTEELRDVTQVEESAGMVHDAPGGAPEYAPGQQVSATVTGVEDKRVLVTLSDGKTRGVIPIRELSVLHVDHPSEVVSPGDVIEAVVLHFDQRTGQWVLSKRKVGETEAWRRLKQLYDSQETFDVVVHDVVKGGLVTDVGVRGFIPASLVDVQFVENLEQFKGQTIPVKVNEIDPENNKLILSRKAALEEQQRQAVKARLESIRVGDVLTGTVARLTSFGAFVDIGGVDGLVHISELSRQHVQHPSEVVKVGDTVQVKVLAVDPDAGRVSLSIKEAGPDPWTTYLHELREGDVISGVVRRVVDFGAFVEVRPGLEGLVHVSRISHQHVEKATDVLSPGQTVQVKVLAIDPERRRISLSMRDAQPRRGGRETKSFEAGADQASGVTLGDLFGDLFKRS